MTPDEKRDREIKSPMVGTIYDAPTDVFNKGTGPMQSPYVKVGDRVHPDTIVCGIEAMMVFNEVKAKVCGTITEKLFSPEESVEYDQPLFKISPA